METSTTEALAARMYPSMAPAPAASTSPAAAATPAAVPAAAPALSTQPTPRDMTQIAEAMYGAPATDLPTPEAHADAEMQALRDDPAERMYSRPEAERTVRADLFDSLVGQQVEVDGQMVEITEEFARKSMSELRAMAADLGLSSQDAAAVNEGLALAESFKGDEAKVIAARESAVELLNAEHGEGAAFAARAARAFVAKNPKLAQVLERTGAGDAPQVVALIARRAVALHSAGKLTVPGASQSKTPQPTAAQRLYPGMNP